jgi:hypothetical protein
VCVLSKYAVQVVQQLLEEQDRSHAFQGRLEEADAALTAAAEEVSAMRALNSGEAPSESLQSMIEDLHERVRCL